MEKALAEKIPEFNKKQQPSSGVGLSGASFGLGEHRTKLEIIVIALVAVVIVGGAEFLLTAFNVPQYVLPQAEPDHHGTVHRVEVHLAASINHHLRAACRVCHRRIDRIPTGRGHHAVSLRREGHHALYSPAGDDADVGARAALLILRFGFGSEPRIIAVALASGPMVMINSATGFRRVDLAKIALARSFGANTFQIFTKIRIPMAMPMIIVGLMVGSIFGLLTTIGAEMVGGAEGLGNRLTYYSSLIRMPQFFAIILILAGIGISIYIFFFWLGKKWASWET